MKYIIDAINLFGYHGIYEIEKENGQNFKINLEYEDASISDKISDDIANVIDYTEIINIVKKVFNSKKYDLIEKLAYDIVFSLSKKFNIINIEITITKVNPYNSKEVGKVSCVYRK